jgi:hypothetical protein
MTDYELVDAWTFPEPVVLRFPAGFHYDGASVPRIVRSLLDDDQLRGAGPLAHDAIYRYGGKLPLGWVRSASGNVYVYTRRQADAFFRKVMSLDGVRPEHRMWAWLGVRVGGFFAWDSLQKRRRRG